jgi:hypothetical protein
MWRRVAYYKENHILNDHVSLLSAEGSSETSAYFCQFTRHCIPEEFNGSSFVEIPFRDLDRLPESSGVLPQSR